MTIDKDTVSAMVRQLRDSLFLIEFDPEAPPSDERSSSRYVEGWNDHIDSIPALPTIADTLEALQRQIEARDDIIAAGARTIESGNEAFRTLREQWRAENTKLLAEVERVTARAVRQSEDLQLMAGRSGAAVDALETENDQLRAEVERLRTGTDRVMRAIGDLEDGQVCALISNAACEWCGELWPHLDGKELGEARAFAAEHAITCTANPMRDERDAALQRVAQLEAALWEASAFARDPEEFAKRFVDLLARKP